MTCFIDEKTVTLTFRIFQDEEGKPLCKGTDETCRFLLEDKSRGWRCSYSDLACEGSLSKYPRPTVICPIQTSEDDRRVLRARLESAFDAHEERWRR
jgi:hypothetical protein